MMGMKVELSKRKVMVDKVCDARHPGRCSGCCGCRGDSRGSEMMLGGGRGGCMGGDVLLPRSCSRRCSSLRDVRKQHLITCATTPSQCLAAVVS